LNVSQQTDKVGLQLQNLSYQDHPETDVKIGKPKSKQKVFSQVTSPTQLELSDEETVCILPDHQIGYPTSSKLSMRSSSSSSADQSLVPDPEE